MADSTLAKPNAEARPQEMDFIHPEPPMVYQPPSKEVIATSEPIHERGPRRVTKLSKLGSQPADVDCPYCKAVVRTKVQEVSSGDDGMIQCLICLVCWPMLFCYESNKDLDHLCSVCGRRLTHRPHGSALVQVVAQSDRIEENDDFEESKYAQAP